MHKQTATSKTYVCRKQYIAQPHEAYIRPQLPKDRFKLNSRRVQGGSFSLTWKYV